MSPSRTTGRARLSFESFGARIAVESDDRGVLDRLRDRLPPGATPTESVPVDDTYSIVLADASDLRGSPTYCLVAAGDVVAENAEIDEIIEQLASRLDFNVALRARDALFVHAGVVAVSGAAILVPGRSTSGKTTLVDALVTAGASYYSDEYAVVDPEGLVHPYPKPISIRGLDGSRPLQPAPPVYVGDHAIPAGMVVVTHYEPGAEWSPRPLSPAQGVLALLDNTVLAQSLPDFGLPALGRLASGAVTVGGRRGDAVPAAAAMLQYFLRHERG